MKKMVKSLVLVALFVTVLSVPVFATEAVVKNTTVRATAESTDAWEWSIPTYIDIEGSAAGSVGGANVEVNVTSITSGYGVNVTFTGSNNNFKLVRDGSPATEVSYALWCQGNAVTEAGQAIGSDITSYVAIPLAATLTQNITVAGNYSDVIGFSAYVGVID